MNHMIEVTDIFMLGRYVAAGALVITEGIRDFRRKEISLKVCIVFAAIGVLFAVPFWQSSWPDFIAGILTGVLLLVIAGISRESIGYGDGVIILAAGVLLGGHRTILLLMYALFFCCLYALTRFLFRMANRKKRIAFVPFMIPSYLLILTAEVMRYL